VQIVVNTRLLLRDRLEGMGWFSYQTLKRITRRHPDTHFVFLFDRPFDEQFMFADNVTPMVISPQARHPLLYYTWFQHSVKGLLNKMKPDLFLSPDGFLSLGAKCRQLPVIHDINFRHYPKDSRWLTSRYYNHYFPRFARAATRIATVSEYSKNDIAGSYGIDPAKIDVVYNGVNEFFRPLDEYTQDQARKKFSYGKPYFLFVGSLHPRKNAVRLIEAFTLFKSRHSSPVKLVFSGPSLWGLKEIHKAIEASSAKEDLVFTGRLSNEDLAQVTGSALALAYVPYYEGFGIPLIEAMTAGVPVISSNVTSLPEVTADAGLLVDPMNKEAIADAMARLWKDEDLRKTLREKGKQRAKNFSWDKTADLLWKSITTTIHQK
jgi:glycosyltransferase involved in cell wall biosynthesis